MHKYGYLPDQPQKEKEQGEHDDSPSLLQRQSLTMQSSGNRGGSHGSNGRLKKQLKEAIKKMQRFAHLPATGRLDNVTLALLTRPRCGAPDLSPFGPGAESGLLASARAKRYVLQGTKWPNPDLTWR